MLECDHLNCNFNTDGRCLDPVLKDPYRQTGCIFYTGGNIRTEEKEYE